MKIKIFLLILIFGTSYLVWIILKNNSPQKPIEIISNYSEDKNYIKSENDSENKTEETLNKPEEIAVIEEKEIAKTEPIEKEPVQKTESESEKNFITNKKVSWGFSVSDSRTIDTLVIHSSYDALGTEPYDLDGLIKVYKQYQVAPHFLIDRKGKIYRLVDEKNIAYHAGVSKMPDGRTGVNNFSIGIELINTEEDHYTANQYSNLNKLIDYLEDNYKIKYILGHQDISPDRKTDPWNFDWKKVSSSKSIHN